MNAQLQSRLLEGRPVTLDAGISERRWAANKTYQRFLGKYKLHKETGLYFCPSATSEQIAQVARCFFIVPDVLAQRALEYNLTVSFVQGATLAGNSSTFYADFSQSTPRAISPHVEIGSKSMCEQYLLGHFAHELAHLLYRSSSWESRQAWQALIRSLATRGHGRDTVIVEVTHYVQGFLDEYLATQLHHRKEYVQPHVREHRFFSYAEEAFCDTVSTIVLSEYGLRHPEGLGRCNVDLEARKELMDELFGLDFN